MMSAVSGSADVARSVDFMVFLPHARLVPPCPGKIGLNDPVISTGRLVA
jgi:hypothetical protein